MWESNPPKRLLTPQTGFEDQRAHQHPSTPIEKIIRVILLSGGLYAYFRRSPKLLYTKTKRLTITFYCKTLCFDNE